MLSKCSWVKRFIRLRATTVKATTPKSVFETIVSMVYYDKLENSRGILHFPSWKLHYEWVLIKRLEGWLKYLKCDLTRVSTLWLYRLIKMIDHLQPTLVSEKPHKSQDHKNLFFANILFSVRLTAFEFIIHLIEYEVHYKDIVFFSISYCFQDIARWEELSIRRYVDSR